MKYINYRSHFGSRRKVCCFFCGIHQEVLWRRLLTYSFQRWSSPSRSIHWASPLTWNSTSRTSTTPRQKICSNTLPHRRHALQRCMFIMARAWSHTWVFSTLAKSTTRPAKQSRFAGRKWTTLEGGASKRRRTSSVHSMQQMLTDIACSIVLINTINSIQHTNSLKTAATSLVIFRQLLKIFLTIVKLLVNI